MTYPHILSLMFQYVINMFLFQVFSWKTNFTELSTDTKENVSQNQAPMQRAKLTTAKKQVKKR